MQKTDHNKTATIAHRKVRSSTTLNRRYVRKPRRAEVEQSQLEGPSATGQAVSVSVSRSPKIQRFSTSGRNSAFYNNTESSRGQDDMVAAQAHPMQVAANERMRRRSVDIAGPAAKAMTARELKDQAIQKALASASRPLDSESSVKSKAVSSTKHKKKSKSKNFGKMHFGFGRVMLALSCAAVAVFAIVYFVNLNMPDLSLRVAAMQTGIEASYPSYVPRDFSLSDITSEDGKVTLNFRNAQTGDAFSLVEESSSWDSNALLTNYVRDAYDDNYTIVREQGLTLYVSGSDASWVNGGVVYKLSTVSGSLTKKQIKSIATSL